MNITIKPAPVRKSILVKAAPQKAFEVFTGGMVRWWPKTHSINPQSPIKDIVMEPRAGGRWWERGENGSECTWGKVLVWEPPSRLVLAWEIDGAWTHNPAVGTEVEIKFIAEGAGTRVELEHRNLEKLGEHAAAMRGAFESPEGWSGILAGLATAAEAG